MRIGILGHYGAFNLGDEATIEAVIQNIRLASRKWTPYCISVYPDDSQSRYQVEAFPIQRVSKRMRERQSLLASNLDVPQPSDESMGVHSENMGLRHRLKRFSFLVRTVRSLRTIGHAVISCSLECRFLVTSFKNIGKIDLLLITGSNQCFDYIGGPWYVPYNLLKWSVMARLRRKKLAFVCVGAGPINASLSEYMIRKSLALAHYRSFRDENSKNIIDAIGAGHTNDHVLPDLAFSLTVREYSGSGRSPHLGSKSVVGINPMPLWDERYWPDGDPRKYSNLVQNYADFASWLLERDYSLFFYATHPKDVLVVEDIVTAMGQPNLYDAENCFPKTVEQLMQQIAGADIAVATRFHGVLLPYILSKPVLGIEYWTKTKNLMEYMGQSKYLLSQSEFVNNSEGFDLTVMTGRFETLDSNLGVEQCTIRERLSAHQSALAAQYQFLWALGGSSQSQTADSYDGN